MSPVQAHRLVLLADKEGKASEAEDLLFEAIYENGKNVSDIITLEQIGEQLQLPGVRLLPSLPLLCPSSFMRDMALQPSKCTSATPLEHSSPLPRMLQAKANECSNPQMQVKDTCAPVRAKQRCCAATGRRSIS